MATPTIRRWARAPGGQHRRHHRDLGPRLRAQGRSADAAQDRPTTRKPRRAGERGWKKPRSGHPGQRPPPKTRQLTVRDVNHLRPLSQAAGATEGLCPSRPRYRPLRPALERHRPRLDQPATEKGGGRNPLAAGRDTHTTAVFLRRHAGDFP